MPSSKASVPNSTPPTLIASTTLLLSKLYCSKNEGGGFFPNTFLYSTSPPIPAVIAVTTSAVLALREATSRAVLLAAVSSPPLALSAVSYAKSQLLLAVSP